VAFKKRVTEEKVKENISEEEVIIPKIYTDIVTVSKVYSILKDIAIDWLMTGKMSAELQSDLELLEKQATGKGSFDPKIVTEKLTNYYEYLFTVIDKLLLNGKEAKVVEVYEIITRTTVDRLEGLDIEVLLGAIANFSLSTGRKSLISVMQIMGTVRGMKR